MNDDKNECEECAGVGYTVSYDSDEEEKCTTCYLRKAEDKAEMHFEAERGN